MLSVSVLLNPLLNILNMLNINGKMVGGYRLISFLSLNFHACFATVKVNGSRAVALDFYEQSHGRGIN